MASDEPVEAPFGVLLIDKPLGPTSHDVVGFVRWALRERAVGHCGTLDPAASGLLVVCVGAATKLVEHLTALDKTYRARVVLGRSTTTADAEGETLVEQPVDPGLADAVGDALAGLQGELELPPPAYSAIKLAGRRAHELARAGEHVEMPLRTMRVHRVALHGVEAGQGSLSSLVIDATFEVAKGTYVRSLAEELGRRLGVPAHLGALRRTACGVLDLDRPDVVSGLIASRLEPWGCTPNPRHRHKGEPPRWRIDRGEAPDAGREALAAHLRKGLVAPWTCLPFEVRVLDGDEPSVWARLRQGQRLSFDDRTRAALGLADLDGPCALARPSTRELLIAVRRAGQLAPERWVRWG